MIELSIVLVIIGLIVGGVLVGRDLISSAEMRAQIAQIEKYNTAVNTFRGKFNAIPGDMAVSTANSFGFANAGCAATAGHRDGNGLIEGNGGSGSYHQGGAETGLFWNDLSSSVAGNLISGSFNSATCTSTPTLGSTGYSSYMPNGIISGSSIYVYSNGGSNYFGLAGPSYMVAGSFGSKDNLTVIYAYNIDKKMDDGIPNRGNVLAQMVYDSTTLDYATSGATSTQYTCFETTNNTYSLDFNNGSSMKCNLVFKFQ